MGMVLVRISKKHISYFLSVFLFSLFCFNVFLFYKNRGSAEQYKSIFHWEDSFGQAELKSFIAKRNISADIGKPIEIFSIKKGEVIKETRLTTVVQGIIESYLKGITGTYVKAKPFPVEGYIIRIPVNPGIKTESSWLNDCGIYTVNEIFILFPEEGKPFLLILDGNSMPCFYNFEGDTERLLKELDFEMKL